MYGNFTAHAGVVGASLRIQGNQIENGDLYFASNDWNPGVGKANIGAWFFVSGVGTERYITNSSVDGGGIARNSIGDFAFFFGPSTISESNYIDAYFNLTQNLPLNQKLIIDSNYLWNDGFRAIEYMTGIGNDAVFRIEHGGGTDALFLRTGASFSISTNSNVFTKAITTEVSALVNQSTNQQTGILIQLKEKNLSSYFYQNSLPITLPIKQLHIYVGGVQPGTVIEQKRFGLFVNNIQISPNS